MAYKTALLAQLFIFNVLLAIAGQPFTGRHVPNSRNVDKKQPEFFIGSDGTVLIPGIGRVKLTPIHKHLPYYNPYADNSGGKGSSGGNIPGGDDTFLPNPGVEVPWWWHSSSSTNPSLSIYTQLLDFQELSVLDACV